MTIATDTAPPKAKIDWTKPVLWLFAAVMMVLIVLPMSWLALFAFTDKARHPTLQNFVTLFTDPDFLDPLLTTAIIATTSAVICCLIAAPIGWLVSRTDMPGRQTIRALVTASFVTPPFLGAVAWELLAAPNSGLLNQLYRFVTGGEADAYLFNIYSLTGIIFVISCYTFPFVFVLVANALDNMPGELEDASAILGGKAWTTARRVTIPLALPALVAGALIAFLQAMTLFGSPAILALPAGFHTMTTKIWSLFQYPPKLELAAAAAVPLLLLTILLLQGQKFLLGRRGFSVVGGKYGAPRAIELNRWRWVALMFCLIVLLSPVFLPYFALLNAAFSPNATTLVTPSTMTLHNIVFVFTELSSTQLALKNTVILGVATATIGTILALVIAYVTTRRVISGHRFLGFLATAPIAVPGIVLGVGLFLSYTRPPFVLYGTLWILLLAFLTINLPSAYQQLQAAFATIHPELEDASRILGATRLQSLRQITAPLLRTGVIATWCFIFIGVMRELSAAIVLFTSQTKVLSVLIYDLNESGDLAAIAVLGIAMLIITFAVVLAVNRIPGFGGNATARLRNRSVKSVMRGRSDEHPTVMRDGLLVARRWRGRSSRHPTLQPIRRDLGLELIERHQRRGRIHNVFPLGQHRKNLQIDGRRMMDHVAVIIELVRDRLNATEIVQAHIGEFRQARKRIGREVVDGLQRCGRGVPHRHELQDRIGRKVDLERHVRIVLDQADGVALERLHHRRVVIAFRKIPTARRIGDAPER